MGTLVKGNSVPGARMLGLIVSALELDLLLSICRRGN